MNDNRLPPGWRVTELLPDDPRVKAHEEYAKQVAKELSAIPRQKIPPTTTQCASTQATLDRDTSLDEQHWNRSDPKEMDWKRDRDVQRLIAPEEYDAAKRAQRASKNTTGQSDMGSVDKEKRDRGIHAFTYSEPVKLADLTPEQRRKITKLEEIVNTPIEPEKPKKKSWRNFWGWAQGDSGMEMFKDDTD